MSYSSIASDSSTAGPTTAGSATAVNFVADRTRASATLELRFQHRRSSFSGNMAEHEEDDPLAGLVNLFDVAMVFSVALMVALVSYLQIPALLNQSDYTVITNPGTPEMEIIVKEENEIKRYEATDATGAGQGELLGQAYRLPDGRVIYVPAESEKR
ncbi:MAG: DUF2149 domain-containing protein [Planctomyces sp.]|nr:DUF2149 domain-containing protein [Planctomyces sp.]